MKQRPKINFREEISVRTKVNANMTVTITVMNHTTMDTMVGIFNFRDIIKDNGVVAQGTQLSEPEVKMEPKSVCDNTDVVPEESKATEETSDDKD